MNAIIMAAGTGTRLMPFTADRPKALVEIEGVSIIERQIRFFRERGVGEITIVTGHRPEGFAGLVARYRRISLVHNDKYDVWNNLYTVYLVRDRLADSFVAESDVCMHGNYIPAAPPGHSLVFGGLRSGFAKEWIIRAGRDGRIDRIDVEGGEGIIECGLTYWTAADAPVVRARLEEFVGAGRLRRALLGRRLHVPLRRARHLIYRDRSRPPGPRSTARPISRKPGGGSAFSASLSRAA